MYAKLKQKHRQNSLRWNARVINILSKAKYELLELSFWSGKIKPR